MNRIVCQQLAVVVGMLSLAAPGFGASGWKSQGEVTAESRQFTDDDQDHTQDFNLGLFARVDSQYRKGPWRVRVRAFGRVDHEDETRDLTAFEEAWAGYRKGPWDVRLGFQMWNWTATEAFHPADIVNSRNLDSNIENPEKLGELMFSVRRSIRDGGLSLYYMPRYEAPNLPGPSSRLSFLPAGFTVGEPIWLEDDEISSDNYGSQWGARFTQTIGNADLSVHYLDHMDRQFPVFSVDPQTLEARPAYSQVQDLGLTYLHIFGGVIFKLEYAHKAFEDHVAYANYNQVDHDQAAFGLEYGWNGQSGSETTLLFEGMGIFGTTEQERANLSPFQRDILAGVRHAWNDTMGRELLFTCIYDLERNHEILLNFSYKQRLSDTWSIEGGLRWIDAPQKEAGPVGLENLDESNQAFLELSRFF